MIAALASTALAQDAAQLALRVAANCLEDVALAVLPSFGNLFRHLL
jgi:hypothetical protein